MRAVPETDKARLGDFVLVFNEWSERFDISTPMRAAHFLAQCWYESANLHRLEENMNYSAERLMQVFPKYFKSKAVAEEYARQPERIANRVYAGRMGNGPEQSGDGWRFHGRGMIQLTGRENYRMYGASKWCNGNVVNNPHWLLTSPGAYKSAMWFWKEKGCNQLADDDDVQAVTRRVNGGLNGLADRMFLLRRFKRELAVL